MKTMLKNKIPSIMIFTITTLSVLMTINIVNQLSSKNDSRESAQRENTVSIEYYQVVNNKNSDISFAQHKTAN